MFLKLSLLYQISAHPYKIWSQICSFATFCTDNMQMKWDTRTLLKNSTMCHPGMNIHQLIILMKVKTHSNKAKTLSFFAFNSGSIEYSCILTNYFYRGHSVTVQTVKAEIIEKKHQACSKRRESNPQSPNYLVRGLPLCFSFLFERMYFFTGCHQETFAIFLIGAAIVNAALKMSLRRPMYLWGIMFIILEGIRTDGT